MYWYKRKDGVLVLKIGRYKVLEITRKWNFEYHFYKCLVFDKGKIVASEGIHGSSLNTKAKAEKWGLNKAKQLKIIDT